MDFNDRFIIATPSLDGVDIRSLTDEQLEALSQPVREYCNMVRSYSALISRKGALEIYYLATEHVDPRIALILAAARDNTGIRIFPDLTTVKEVMFGETDPSESAFVNPELNIFTQGVRRVSAALVAATLIGQLAQIDQQAEHAKLLEERSLADLDRLLQVPDLQAAAEAKPTSDDETKSFYFEPFEMQLGTRILRAELFMASSAITSWQLINNYTGTFSTAEIVADLADAINTYSLVQQTTNIIAAPMLGESSVLYKIEFKARFRDALVSAEVVSVRFSYTDGERDPLPFNWGTAPSAINTEKLNSVLLTVQQGKATATAITSATRTGEPTVLYFRRAPVNDGNEVLDWQGTIISQAQWAAQGNLTFRISPMMLENATATIPYLTNIDPIEQAKLDALRPNQVAEQLLNEMFAIKGETLSLGALIRNDYPGSTSAMVGLELIAYSVTNPEAWMILDLLEIPADIEIAVGNLLGPLTSFSNRPKSVRVESKFFSGVAASSLGGSPNNVKAIPKVAKIPISERLQAVRDNRLYRVTDNRFPI